MISENVIQEIKERVDLTTIINLKLKPVGQLYQALCPFHTEKTPSFTLYPDNNSWFCFGCHEGGDVISYVQKRDGLSFREALQWLADECGMNIEQEKESEEQSQMRVQRERLLALCEAAAEQFQQWLYYDPDAQDCRDYVKGRDLSAEMIHRFKLGYALDSWDRLLSSLTARGYDALDMVQVGLARERKNGGYYDALRDRLVFPIRDLHGRIIGFGGRALQDVRPKYINSPQSLIFKKGHLLYGLDLAKDAIRKSEQGAIVVEGYMDCITAHQAGFTNVVASLGTAITTEQLKLLTRYGSKVTLALDADVAGQLATERSLLTLLDLNKQVGPRVPTDIRVLILPENSDPDDFIRQNRQNPEEWQNLVAQALPVMDYLIMQRLRNISLSNPTDKMRAANDLLPMIADLDTLLMRDHYIARLARLLQVDERTLAREMFRLQSRDKRHASSRSTARTSSPNQTQIDEALEELRDLEAYLLYLILQDPTWLPHLNEITPDMWKYPLDRAIWEAMRDKGIENTEQFIADLDPALSERTRQIISFYSAHTPIPAAEFQWQFWGTLSRFILNGREQQIHQINLLMQAAPGNTHHHLTAEMKHLLQRRTELMKSRFKWQKTWHNAQKRGAGGKGQGARGKGQGAKQM
ncbi:MAG: DNA primase [Ardenticatenaceae bacterium]